MCVKCSHKVWGWFAHMSETKVVCCFECSFQHVNHNTHPAAGRGFIPCLILAALAKSRWASASNAGAADTHL
jgi:hypothetical protein